MSNERPILMNGAMVRATLDGSKTQTRRIMKPQPEVRPSSDGQHWWPSNLAQSMMSVEQFQQHPGIFDDLCPHGRPGDRLWVREAFARTAVCQAPGQEWVVYREGDNRTDYGGPWKPSIHMPRSASRIMLEITGVRIERLQDISDSDIEAEGIDMVALAEAQERYDVVAKDGNASGRPTLRSAWRDLWESTGGDWDANPWLWAISFLRVKP
ncbi:hypothetical protein [Duganella phyllosphaerae]|uniref:Phage-related protein n=1 Tax=Duganella phyllosphaerae TaxID=762836 RepID=A0A1E7W6A0_9BURK|nr:hypothetical protein [Duganella phyllosphaerae]OEZ91524.1 hypothetical protein DUPY_51360 [Duganella phyllosphaerae]